MYINYLNLPSIPDDILESIEDINNRPLPIMRDRPRAVPFLENNMYNLKDVNRKTWDYLQSIFPFSFFCRYQYIHHQMPIHVDIKDRRFAINYLLDTGGPNVTTSIYDNGTDLNLIESVCIEPFRWHSIKTDEWHGVSNLTPESKRLAISVSSNGTRAFDKMLEFLDSVTIK
jgi:hypothetical protein